MAWQTRPVISAAMMVVPDAVEVRLGNHPVTTSL
jgi:hypothetical protein